MSDKRSEQWAAQYGDSWPERLRGLAQNDYLIDQNILPDGHMLIEAADHFEALEAEVERLTLALDAEKKAHEATTAAALRAHFPDPSADLAAARAERDGLAKALTHLYLAGEETVKYATSAPDRKPWVDTLSELCNALIAARAALAALPGTTKEDEDAPQAR